MKKNTSKHNQSPNLSVSAERALPAADRRGGAPFGLDVPLHIYAADFDAGSEESSFENSYEGGGNLWESSQVDGESFLDESREQVGTKDIFSQYISAVGSVKRLTEGEERALAVEIQNAKELLERALAQSGSSEELTRLQKSYYGSRNQMVEANLRLVVSIAKRYSKAGLSILDLVQEGNMALMKAAETFDARRGTRFSTYATWLIKAALMRSIDNQGRLVRVPVNKCEKLRALKRAGTELAQQLGRVPTTPELACHLKMSVSEVCVILDLRESVTSFLQPVSPGSSQTLGEVLKDSAAWDPGYSDAVVFLQERLGHYLAELTLEQATVLRWLYGIENGTFWPEKEVAKVLGMSVARVREAHLQALERIRASARNWAVAA